MRPVNYISVDLLIETNLSSRHSEPIQKWARTVLKNGLYNTAPVHKLIINKYSRWKRGKLLTTSKPLDYDQFESIAPVAVYIKHCGWCSVSTEVQKDILLKDSVCGYANQRIVEASFEILDWMIANPDELPKDLTLLSYKQARSKSIGWHDSVRYASLSMSGAARVRRFNSMWQGATARIDGIRIIEGAPTLQANPFLTRYQQETLSRLIGMESTLVRILYGGFNAKIIAEHCEDYASIISGKNLGQRMQLAPGIWVLLDAEALRLEGAAMGHCVASYWAAVESKRTFIYHIDNRCATLEITDNKVAQIKTRFNGYTEVSKEDLIVCLEHAEKYTVLPTHLSRLGLTHHIYIDSDYGHAHENSRSLGR